MKKEIVRFISIPIFVCVMFSTANGQFQFLSPYPSSKLNKPETNIIISASTEFDESAVQSKKLITVTGSISGKHDVHVILCEKGKTMVLSLVYAYTLFGSINRISGLVPLCIALQ